MPIKVFWPLVALWETSAFTHQHCHEPALIDRVCVHLVVCVLTSPMWDLSRGSEAHEHLLGGQNFVFNLLNFMVKPKCRGIFKIIVCKMMINIIK